VISVDNQLIVKEPTTVGTTANEATHETHTVSDAWISTKVKSTLMYSSNVDGSDITVNTDDGIVTLSGKVESGAERELAIELAKNVRGVQSVASEGLVI
jgi:osmotically-inducible protein OsmY